MRTITIPLLACAVLVPPAAPLVSLDPLQQLASALARFGGVGDSSVTSYRVSVRIPDDASSSVAIDEIWRAPSELVVRGHDASAPGAIVRSLALYLEPLYVARCAVVDLDWSSVGTAVRERAVVRASASSGDRTIHVDFARAATLQERLALPEALRDIAKLEATLDANERLRLLNVALRDGAGSIVVKCEYDAKTGAAQPTVARWTLPSGEAVVVRTTFRRDGRRFLPASRRVTFPSRFDPKETEEIRVEYGAYELNPAIPDSIWSARGSFGYDANGLEKTRR